MIDYRHYSVEELARDESFRRWILDPTEEVKQFWENWLIRNPDRQMKVNQATELLLGIYERYRDDLSEENIREEIAALVALAESGKKKKRLLDLTNPILRIAAMLTLLTGFAAYYYHSTGSKPSGIENSTGSDMVTKRNMSGKEMTLLLADGSIATLKTGSSLRFPRRFSGSDRRVFLTGEGFFNVAKDPANPFLVITHATVTKVLGTSFRVKAFEGDNTVMVVVKTGKVSVYTRKANEGLPEKNIPWAAVGVVLQPNQQVVFDKKENKLEKGMVKNPAMLIESASNQELVIDDEPVSRVLKTLEKMYGITIQFDEVALSRCPVSTIFKEENLKQRLNAICQAIGANYEVLDGRIVLSGKGCNN
jgi:transmembrane sensor